MRHVGDLGNIEAVANTPTVVNIVDDDITLEVGPQNGIIGKKITRS